jgi:hypothetical protein
MEESKQTIREPETRAISMPPSWLCDNEDRPMVEYIHDGNERYFRIRVGALWYEHFGENERGEWWYRRVA